MAYFRTSALAKWFVDLAQIVALVMLAGLVPYSLFAGYEAFVAVSASTTGTSAGAVVYAIARLAGCLLLVYALWRLRQAAVRLRKADPRRG
jgi:hypothetical protein